MRHASNVIIVVSGLSGAGKSTALHALEDLGFFCTDNLPVDLLDAWYASVFRAGLPAAVCLDIRSFQGRDVCVPTWPGDHRNWLTLFIDADDATLQRRFSLLRRRHPFSNRGGTSEDIPLLQAIRNERKALRVVREQADLVLDSSTLNPYELADLVEVFWIEQSGQDPERRQPICSLYSFSYRRGLPQGADMVLDARYLPNPHYIPHLAPLTGRDEAIRAFFSQYPEVSESISHIEQWLMFLWPRLRRERKQYFTLAIGCSGGRHRSVFLIEAIARWMREEELCVPLVVHRELQDRVVGTEEREMAARGEGGRV